MLFLRPPGAPHAEGRLAFAVRILRGEFAARFRGLRGLRLVCAGCAPRACRAMWKIKGTLHLKYTND